MKIKPTQEQVITEMLINGMEVTGSNAYAATKKLCGNGTLNLHIILRLVKRKGYIIKEKWNRNETTKTNFKSFTLDTKRTRKSLLSPKHK